MRVQCFILSLVLVLSGGAGFSQMGEPFSKTMTTAFPLSSKSSWECFAVNDQGSEYCFCNSGDLILTNQIIKIWVRQYSYSKNVVIQAMWMVNLTENESKITNPMEYNMKTKEITNFFYGFKDDWSPNGPGTTAEALYRKMKEIENNKTKL